MIGANPFGKWSEAFACCEEPEALGDSGARQVGVSGGAFVLQPGAKTEADHKTVDPATEVQAHVDAVLSDLARDRLKPQQIKQIQHAATDAALRRAVRGVR